MNIMVFDVPASSAGALSILTDFHNEIKTNIDDNVNWFFVISTPELSESENIKVLRFPWVKKSWAHRAYFDHFVAPKLIKKHDIDKVLSFQNVVVPHTGVPQVLYVHQPLPFVDYKFSFKENKTFWAYQNLISRIIKKSIKKAQKTIVQTHWMKEACINQIGVHSNKIKVIPPKINIDINKYFAPTESSKKRFFFPSGAQSYKNHRVIIDACKKLKEQGIENYNIIFTLKGSENEHISKLYNEVKKLNLPVNFVGSLPREEVFELYTKSILIFPSYIETFGLPMLEARLHKTIVLASDCPFSREILKNYENAYFFDPFNPNELKVVMKQILVNDIEYKKTCEDALKQSGNGWADLLKELC